MQDVQLPVIVGFIVSLVFQMLKKWQWLDCTEAVVKQVTVAVLAAVATLAAAQWQVNQATLLQAVGAAIMALATHKTLLAPSVASALDPTNLKSACDDPKAKGKGNG